MAKFLENKNNIKKPAQKKKKKKQENPSTQERINQKNYGTTKPNVKVNATRTANTVGNTNGKYQAGSNNNTQQRYNNRPQGTATRTRNTPATAGGSQYGRAGTNARRSASEGFQRDMQARQAESRQRNQKLKEDQERRRQESEARRNKTIASRNPRMQDTARSTRLQTEEERRQRQDRLREAQRQKMGDNSMASEKAQRAANRAVRNTPTVVKESLKQTAIGHGKTAADLTELNKSAAIGSKLDIKSKEFQEDIEKRRKQSTRVAGKAFDELSKMQEKSEDRMQKVTGNAKGLEKAYYGALESGTGMALDRALGPAWAVSMLSRTYGNTRGQAKKEGATEAEDRAYSLLQGAKEVATEYLFQGVGLARGLSGRASLAPSEKVAKYVTRNMSGRAADLAHAGIRLLGGTAEENAEEIIGWGLDPFIKEFAYKKNVRSRQAQQMMREQSDSLRSNITSPQEAQAMAAYLGSDDFLEQQTRTYMDSGIGEAEARDLAEQMRDYLDASLSGDTGRMADIEESLTSKLAGKGTKQSLKEEYSLSELMDTVASTTLLTATTGLPGAFTTASKGAAVRDQLGDSGIRALAKTAEDFEDKEMQLKAKAMSDRLASGKDITSTQAYDLAVGVQEQYNKDSDRQQAAYQTANKTIKSERLVTPYTVSRNGDIDMDEVTDKVYQTTAKSAKDIIRGYAESDESTQSLTDTEIDRGSRAIAGFQTGVFTVDDANELNFHNTAVRSAFQVETGVDLNQYVVKQKNGEIDIPATNAATKDALFAMAADNLVKSAQAETANWMDNAKGEVVTQISRRMGAKGTEALQVALDDVDERDRTKYMMTANATDMLYQAARNMGTDWESAKKYAQRMFPSISEEKLKAMYDAGLEDRIAATDNAVGLQIEIGKKAEIKAGAEKAPMGQLLIETDVPVKGTVARTFTELAKNLGVDIHLVDHFTDENGNVLKNVNGEYIDGNIYINVNSDFEKNMGFIFMHEVTHHLKKFAPEQYHELENLVRDKWFNYDAAQMQSAIAKKIETYAKHGQKLTEEQALEEIIADASHEFLTDPKFAREVADADASLAQAVLTSIRNALRALRRIMSSGNVSDDTHMNTLFSQLDILDEAERIWLSAYTQAVKNNAAVEVDRLQNQIYEEGRQSISETSPRPSRKMSDRWENGEKLTHNQFNSWYSAHKLSYGRVARENLDEAIESIKNDGFISSTSISNVVPASINDYTDPNKPNDTQARYGAKEGDVVMLVPRPYVDLKSDIVKNGFKPRDYEIVTVERDFQPYYELYEKAYDDAQARFSIGEDITEEAAAAETQNARFSIVEDPETIKQLDADDHVTTYRGMVKIDGKYYSPMSSKVRNDDGKYELREGIVPGQWVEADITTDSKMFNSKGQFLLRKDNNKTIPAAYNPYMHSSTSMMNDQFETQYDRPNLVVIEGVVPKSELESGYRAEHDLDDGRHVVAKDATGKADWKPGPVERQIPKERQRTVYLSNHFKMVREVPVEEVAQHIHDKLEGTGVQMTYNSVTPDLRKELLKLGTAMKQNKQDKYKVELDDEDLRLIEQNPNATRYSIADTDSEGNAITEEEATVLHDIGPDVRFSVTTENEPQAKAAFRAGKGEYRGYKSEASGRELRTKLIKENFPEDQADAIVKAIDSFMDATGEYLTDKDGLRMRYQFIGWDDLESGTVSVRRDKNGKIRSVNFSAMKKNDEYPVNFDFSTVCNKRISFTRVIEEIAKAHDAETGASVFSEIKLTPDNMWKINEALKAEGIDTACLGCFVESRRYHIDTFFQNVEDRWNKPVREARKKLGLPEEEYFNFSKEEVPGEQWSAADDNWGDYGRAKAFKGAPLARTQVLMNEIVKAGDVDSPLLKLIRPSDLLTPEGFEGFRKLSNAKIDMVGQIKAMYGAGVPKEILGFTPYNSEIALLPKNYKKTKMEKYLKSIGGIRIQSFSDFMIEHVYDHFQLIADAAYRKLPIHAYTKVIAYAKIFGLTGAKINMSVMFDVKNSKQWAEDLGISEENAKKYADKYQGLRFVTETPADYKTAYENASTDENLKKKYDKYISEGATEEEARRKTADWAVRPYRPITLEGKKGYLTYLVSDADYVNEQYQRMYDQYISEGMSEEEAERKANSNKPFEQSINYREAKALQDQDGYRENVGIIGVAFGDEHLRMMMDDENVRYIIPYHSSNLPVVVSNKTNLKVARDYSDRQNTYKAESWTINGEAYRDLKSAYAEFKRSHKDEAHPARAFFADAFSKNLDAKFGDKVEGSNTGAFDVYKSLDTAKEISDVSERYLEDCIENNYIPVFHEFADSPGYYKMLFDFMVADDNGSLYPQHEVRNNYPGVDVDAKAEAGETVTDNDLTELKKVIEEGAKAQNDKLQKWQDRKGNVLQDLLSREGEHSIISDSNINSVRYGTEDYTNPKTGKGIPEDAKLSISEDLDEPYMDAVNNGNMEEAQKYVDEAAKRAGMRVAHRYHGTMNAGFTVFDKAYAKVGGNSGAGFYFSTEKDDSVNHYADVEGADNYFKWSSLAEHINDQINEGTWEGPELETYEDVEEYAKEQLNKNPGTFDVYLNYKNPYIRNGRQSTNIFNLLDGNFDDSVIDMKDYDSEDDYDDDWREYYYEHIHEEIYKAVYGAYSDLENFYDILDAPDISKVTDKLFTYAIEYESLTWDEIENSVWETELIRDDWEEQGYGATEFARAIIENFGYDAIEDKEVDTKFGQLSRKMMTGTEHIIVFRPEQIKLSDPVTYAEDGSVIPLSQRFDPTNNDIRYSISTVDADGNVLTDGQMEYFKNSQARDAQGRLVPVYHTTNNGGFTIFDPSYSDDRRSLFFASNWNVSQTYGHRASRPIDLGKAYFSSWSDFERYAQEEFANDPEWDSEKSVAENLYASAIPTNGGADISFDDWMKNGDEIEAANPYASYEYHGVIQFPTQDAGWIQLEAGTPYDLLQKISRTLGREDSQKGYYKCYLNLENPLIVDAKGHNWNDIPYGEESDLSYEDYKKALEDKYGEMVTSVKIIQEDYDDEYSLPQKISISVERAKKIPNPNKAMADLGFTTIWQYGNVSNDTVSIDLSDFLDGDMPDPADASMALWTAAEEALYSMGIPRSYVDYLEEEHTDYDGDIVYEPEDRDFINYESDEFEVADPFKYEMEHDTPETYRTRELAEMAEANGNDGVIVRNCRDIGGASHLKRGASPMSDIFIAFSSNQVKDTRNTDPTNNPDIRYSVTEDEAMTYAAENAKTTDDLWYTDPEMESDRVRVANSKMAYIESRITKWNERWLTEGQVLDEKSVKSNIRNLIRGVMANSDTDYQYKTEMVDNAVKAAKKAFYLRKVGKYSEAADLLFDTAQEIYQDNKFYGEDADFQGYKELRDFIRKTKFYVPEDQWKDIDMEAFRRNNFGSILLGSDGVAVDTIWEHMNSRWPEWFSMEVTHPADMMLAIEYALEKAKPIARAYASEEAMSLASELADDLDTIISEGKEYVSIADTYKRKYDEKTKQMKQRHNEAMRKYRENLQDKYKKRFSEWKKDYKEKQKNKADHRKLFEGIRDDYDWLSKAVLDPTKTKYIPEAFRASLAQLLMQMDLETARSKQLEKKYGRVTSNTLKLRELRDRLNDLATAKAGDDSNLFDIDSYLPYLMDALAEKYDGQPISAMDVDSLKTMKILFKALRKNFTNLNREAEESKANVATKKATKIVLESNAKIDRDGMAKKYEGLRDYMQTINMTSLTPPYFFERMGTVNDLYKELRGGFDTYVRNEAYIMDRLKGILSSYYNKPKGRHPRPGSELEAWRDARTAKTLELTNGTITMTAAQRMSLYCLTNRKQAMDHMLAGGIVVTPYEAASKIEAAKQGIKGKTEFGERLILSRADTELIKASLTPEQIKMANELQKLMSEDMARLGNEAHREMYGYEIFGEPNYFPIKSKDTWVPKDVNNMTDAVEKIKSFGPSKPLVVNASNAIVVDDIFSVVADHCNGMNLYNAYLVPISNFMRVYNTTVTLEDGSRRPVREALEQAYGKKAMQYIDNFIRDLNGIKDRNRGGLEDIMNKAIGTAKATAVAGNLRVAAQQPTAYVRAAAEIDWKYLAPFVYVRPEKGVMDEMFEYCPIARWKSWGYYDTYMGRDIEDVMMNNWSIRDEVLSGVYGKLDNMTWAGVWQAVKAEQKDKHPEMDHNSREFLEICGARASEVFDKTQVVDSTFHRSDAMRNKQVAVKLFTAFMSEPTLTLNVLRAAVYNYQELMKAGHKGAARKVLGKAISVLLVQAVFVSVAQALADAWRGKEPGFPWDDDDEEKGESDYFSRFLQNLFHNFIDQLHLENNLYLVKDVKPYADFMMSKAMDYAGLNPFIRTLMGWDQEYLYNQNNLVFAGLENTATGVSQLFKKLEKGEDYDKTKYEIIQKIASGIGTFTGLPFGTIMRDAKPIFDKLFTAVNAADTLELPSTTKTESESDGASEKTEDSGEKKSIFGFHIKSDEEKAADKEEEEINKKIQDIKSKTEGLSQEEKNQKIYSMVTRYMKDHQDGKPMADYIAAGDYWSIGDIGNMYIRAGGDGEYFKEKVFRASKSAMKKTISADNNESQKAAQARIKDYLLTNGMTEQELSDIAYKSYTKKDLQVAFRINDEDAIITEMRALMEAGMTREDIYKVYDNRNRVDLVKYKEAGGKYADRLKSTGTYNWPCNGTITSHYGHRHSPGNGVGSTNHQGLDIGASMGAPVTAADGGTVVMAKWYSGYGKTVQIQHDDGTITQYSHLSWWEHKVGDVVAQGQEIGKVGSTGNSTGPHLHFGVMKDGHYVDPEDYLNRKS